LSNAWGTGNGVVTVNVTANPTVAQRAATVTLTAGTLTRTVAVTQDGKIATLTTDKTAIEAVYTAGNYPVAVTSNTTWTATVSAGATWCTVSPISGSGNGTVTVNVTANSTNKHRAATVTLVAGAATQTVGVTQYIQPPPYAASQKTWVFGSRIWSAAIHHPDCDKTDYDAGYRTTNTADCRSYQSSARGYRYYYSYEYVLENINQLCPSPWRWPTQHEVHNIRDLCTADQCPFPLPDSRIQYNEVTAWGHRTMWLVDDACSNPESAYRFNLNPNNAMNFACQERHQGYPLVCVTD
jgi:hypothetical protein